MTSLFIHLFLVESDEICCPSHVSLSINIKLL